MLLPNLTELATHKDVLDVFSGYNHNLRISDGEFYDMKNLTSSYYPVLSPRGKRGVYTEPDNYKPDNPQGMIAKDSLCYIDGRYFCMNEYRIDMELTDSPKTLVSMGAYVIIMPDKKYINTLDLTDFGQIEAVYPGIEGQTVTAAYEMCKVDGTIYTEVTKSPAPPEEPENMQLWIDTSSTPHVLKQYSKTNAIWNPIATTYIKISAPGIASAFKKFDAVKISGFPTEVSQLKDLEGKTFPLWEAYHDKGDTERAEGTNDYIVIIGLLDETVTYETNLRIERSMPKMDFIVESNNRLWGCRYGVANNGEVVNEIYASKLGDFKNWNCFMGVSTDSYVASVGTDGQFTGAISHLGYPLFFKENCLHKIYGNYPANYQIQTTACRGVQKDSEKSLAIVNEVLYYKSQNGICAYDGSLPNEISAEFGDERYSNAVAAAHGNKYYVSMKDSKGDTTLFVYDASKGMWHKEDDLQVTEFCSCRNELYYIANGKIGTMFGSGTTDTAPIPWMAESGVLTAGSPDKKYISKISVRMALDIGTRIYFYIQYDSMGEWEYVSTMTGSSLRTFTVPIKPKRCDHLRLRIVGEGNAKIYSIAKTIENGSDV
jgi:hypothetical protein